MGSPHGLSGWSRTCSAIAANQDRLQPYTLMAAKEFLSRFRRDLLPVNDASVVSRQRTRGNEQVRRARAGHLPRHVAPSNVYTGGGMGALTLPRQTIPLSDEVGAPE